MSGRGERVAVCDLGSNSTRLLIADVAGEHVAPVLRRSVVTRLAEGVESTGRLSEEAIERVHRVLRDYRRLIDGCGAATAIGVLTSAVRDARDGAAFAAAVRERHGIAARTISGETEARLTYRGATAGRDASRPTAVVDVGGGSTEIVVGAGARLLVHASTQVGVVRHGERHLHDDPPSPAQVAALREDAAAAFAAALPAGTGARTGIAVAGTPTQAANVLGTGRLTRTALEDLLARLAALPLARRRQVARLDPDRAPTIVAGLAILLEAMAALELGAVEASEQDLLVGAALERSAFRSPVPHFCAPDWTSV